MANNITKYFLLTILLLQTQINLTTPNLNSLPTESFVKRAPKILFMGSLMLLYSMWITKAVNKYRAN